MNPAEKGYALRQLVERIAAAERRLAELEAARGVSVEVARVTVVGGTAATVTYSSGARRSLPFVGGTPTAGSNVLVVNSPRWSGIVGPVSA